MWFRVDPRSAKPVYQQVVDGIKESVAKGLLPEGEKLPSVRELAAMMTLNPNTVAKAYRELEHERVIKMIRGRGTYVAHMAPPPNRDERLAKMQDTIKQMIMDAHYLGLTDDELYDRVRRALAEWNGGDKA